MDQIKIIQWNIRSIFQNRIYLDQLIEIYKPDVIVLQETLDNTDEGIAIENYQKPTRIKYVYGNKNQGISTYVINKLNQTPIEIKNHDDFSSITVSVENSEGKEYIITNIYRKNDKGTKQLKEHIKEKIKNYKENKHIIMGDFNLHHPLWDNNFLDKPSSVEYLGKSDPIANLLQDKEITVLNNGDPTRIDDGLRHSSALDLTMINKKIPNQIADWYLVDDCAEGDRGFSDHIPIVLSIGHRGENNTTYNDKGNQKETSFNYQKLDKAKLKKELEKINWEEIGHLNHKELNIEINNVLVHTLSKSTKKQKRFNQKNRNHKQVPWWNIRCQEAINRKKNASKKYFKHKTVENKTEYNKIKNESNRIIKEEKCKHWQNYVSSINLNTNTSETWKKIKNMDGSHNKPRIIPTLIDQNKIKHVTNKEKANLLGETYQQISSDQNYSEAFIETKNNFEEINNCNLKDKEHNNNASINNPITLDELEQALKHKKDTKEGKDQIRYTVYKLLPPEGKTVILKLLNNIWESGEIPKEFKHAIIVPILKPGKNTKDPKSYRPISLTSHLGKILETVINNRLMNYLETNDIIKNTQSGFRQKRQTMDHVVRLTHDVETCIKNNKINIAVFLDMQKAFDTLHKQGILLELKKIGVTGQMYNYIQCFLKDRTYQVRIEGELSDTFTQDNGTPQGSVISPTLFNILINSLPDLQTNNPNVEVGKYADDIAIWLKPQVCRNRRKNRIRNQQNISTRTIEKAANELISELEKRGFAVNIAKTQAIMFNKRPTETIKSLKINGEEVNLSNTVKYLGVTFDHKLNFNAHIDELLTRANKSMNILHNLAGRKDWGADPKTLRTTYLGLVRSKLTYGAEVYHRANNAKLLELDKLQNRALRIIAGVRKTAGDTNKLGLLTNIVPLSIHRQISIANLGYRIKANPNNPARDAIKETNHFAKLEIKNLNEEHKKILTNANITETIEEYKPISEHWMKDKFLIDDETYQTEDVEKIYVQTNSSSGTIIHRNTIRNYKFNKGLNDTSINLELVDTALSMVMESADINSDIIIITNQNKSLKILTLEEETHRPETISKIYSKKTEIEKRGIIISLQEGRYEIQNGNNEAINRDIPLTYKEIKPVIQKKIINNIWLKELQDVPNYSDIMEIRKGLQTNLDRNDRHLNHLRLGSFITGFVFPICPYCEEALTVQHVLEACTILDSSRTEAKKHLKALKVPFNTKNLLKPWNNRPITHIIRSFIQDVNDSFKI